MKKQSMIYRAATCFIFAAVFTLAGCGGDNNETLLIRPVPPGPKFNNPTGVVAVSASELYVVDATNHVIRKVVITDIYQDPPAVTVSTFAGKAGAAGTADEATGDLARFHSPYGITTDGTNLFVTDTFNHTIRKIVIGAGPVSGQVTTVAGLAGTKGTDDSTGTDGSTARFNRPYGITYGNGKLYVADHDNHTIRVVDAGTGETHLLAGIPGSGGKDDNTTGTSAKFMFPTGVAVDANYVYVSDTDNHTIRTISLISPNEVKTRAGRAGNAGAVDDATGTNARFYKPTGLFLSGTTLYVVDWLNQVIRTVDVASWSVQKIAGTWKQVQAGQDPKIGDYGFADGNGDVAKFNFPQGITLLDASTLCVADTSNHVLRTVSTSTPFTVRRLVGVVDVPGSVNE